MPTATRPDVAPATARAVPVAPVADRPEVVADDADFRSLLRGYGLRSTSQRIAILHLLAHAPAGSEVRIHLTAAQIHDKLRETDGRIDLTTVYRTLTTLAELGVLHAIALADQPTSYGLAMAAHHHAVCTQCGAVIEIPAGRLAETLGVVRRTTGFRVEDLAVTVHGRCRDCQALDRPHH